MGTRDKGRGTLILDRVFAGVGRIKKASGTNDAKTHKKLNGMLDVLLERGRLDLLEALRDGIVTPLQLYNAYVRQTLDKLPTAESIVPLWSTPAAGDRPEVVGAVDAWLAAWKKSDDHLRATTSTFAQLRKLPKATGATVGDLPALLESYRAACEKAGHATSFNRAKSHVQAFLRERLGRGHTLYKAVQDVERVAKDGDDEDEKPGNPFTTVAEFEAFCERLRALSSKREGDDQDAHVKIARTMVTTGMHAKELWGNKAKRGAPWKLEERSVYVRGTKRTSRKRHVPLVMPPSLPQRHPRTFDDRVRDASGGTRSTYDLRRTYSVWMEAAGIVRTRRRMYMGHKAGDITELYERHEVDAFLRSDAALFTNYLTRGGWTGPLAPEGDA